MPSIRSHHSGRRIRFVFGAVSAVILMGATAFAAGAAEPPGGSGGPPPQAPAVGYRAQVIPPGPDAIPGQYIVTLHDGVDPTAFANEERARGNRVDHVYRAALNGYAGALNPAELARLAADERVTRIEPDAAAHVVTTESNATWGLDRLDQRSLPLDTSYTYDVNGAGVKAYIIDTGIRTTHSEFGGRASIGTDTVGDGQNGNDCHGHGTHVAGTIGGSVYGVAKGVTLVAVRVLDCNGSGAYSGVIAGVDWVTSDHQPGQPAVANMSLGGPAVSSLDDAVARSVSDGVVYAVAAGNDSASACNSSPARTPSALTVAATDSTDTRASFSNFGTCVDVFAPGVGITSAWNTSDTATNTISGTSMATPHVAGVAALTLAGNPGSTVDQVTTAMLSNATAGIVQSPGTGTPNRLLYVGNEPGPPPPPPPPPAQPNDMFADATVISGSSGTANGSNVDATKEAGEPNHAGNGGGASVWYRFTPTVSGTATIDTVGSSFDTLLAVYTGNSVSALTSLASNDDITMFFNVQSRVTLAVNSGTTYRIAVDGYSGLLGLDTGSVTLHWSVAGSPPTSTSTSSSTTSTSTSTTSTSTSTTTTSTSTTTTTTTTNPPPSGDTGWRAATAQAADTGGDGNGYEVNPANALADDGAFAVDADSGTGTQKSCTSPRKDRHRFQDFGISVPNGATVDGIQVQLQAKADSASNSPKLCVALSWDGGTTWTAIKSTGNLTTSEAAYVLGSPTDTWGRSWTTGNLSNSSFRVRVVDVAGSTARDFSLDHVSVRVYY